MSLAFASEIQIDETNKEHLSPPVENILSDEKKLSERERTISEITRKILSIAGITPVVGTAYDRKTWRFVKSFVNNRLRPEYKGRTVTAGDHLAERMSRFLRPNTRNFTTDQEMINGLTVIGVEQKENHVLRKYKTNEGKYIAEIIYGCGETSENEKFLTKLYDDPQGFLLRSDLPIKSQIKITFKHPKDVPINSKIKKMANEGSEKLGIEWEEKTIPLTFQQLIDIDGEVDKGEYMKMAGNPEAHKQLEIRLPTVEKVISEIIERIDEKSTLRKILVANPRAIATQVYEHIKLYKAGNIAIEETDGENGFNAVGALFEACVSYELKSAGLGDIIESLVNVDGTTVSTDSKIYNEYSVYCSQRYISHCDELVTIQTESDTTIAGIIECKVSPSDKLSKNVFSQVIHEIGTLPKVIEKIKNSNNITVKPPRELFAFIIKPNSLKDGKNVHKSISPMFVIGESRAYILRSRVTIEDLDIARDIFNEMAGIKTKKQAPEMTEA